MTSVQATNLINAANWVASDYQNRVELLCGRPPAIVYFGFSTVYPVAPLDDAVNALVRLGLPTFVPAGNRGRPAGNGSPAGATEATVVGGVTRRDKWWARSNHGPLLEFLSSGAQRPLIV
jgi:hypothetical protein